MPAIRFPFWILVPHSADKDGSCQDPSHVCTFSSAARAIAYMEACNEGEWDVKLVSRPSRPEIKAFLQRNGIQRVCHDQNADGTGGTSILVEELLGNWDL